MAENIEPTPDPVVAPPSIDTMTDEQLLAALADPRAQQILESAFTEAASSAARATETRIESTRRQAEATAAIDQLIESGDFESLGKRVADDYQRQKVVQPQLVAAQQVAATQAREQAINDIANGLLSAFPELKSLTAEERTALDPSKYKSDGEFVGGIVNVVVARRAAAAPPAKTPAQVIAENNSRALRTSGIGASAGLGEGAVKKSSDEWFAEAFSNPV